MPAPPRWTADAATVRPMLASPLAGPVEPVLRSPAHVFERKYDGMRVLAEVPVPEVAGTLVQAALAAGSRDNVTAVVARYVGGE